MNQKAIQTIKPTLEGVQDQFRIWRKTRKKRTSIPRDLWQAAKDLTQYYSINTVSKALGLSYTDLKRRVKASRTDVCSSPSPSEYLLMTAKGSGFAQSDYRRDVFDGGRKTAMPGQAV